ncbi:unnamed protein product [Closterium sp. Yama58-4]|nr:unnamed protein product [Closterium sp. Yama58-4]
MLLLLPSFHTPPCGLGICSCKSTDVLSFSWPLSLILIIYFDLINLLWYICWQVNVGGGAVMAAAPGAAASGGAAAPAEEAKKEEKEEEKEESDDDMGFSLFD